MYSDLAQALKSCPRFLFKNHSTLLRTVSLLSMVFHKHFNLFSFISHRTFLLQDTMMSYRKVFNLSQEWNKLNILKAQRGIQPRLYRIPCASVQSPWYQTSRKLGNPDFQIKTPSLCVTLKFSSQESRKCLLQHTPSCSGSKF